MCRLNCSPLPSTQSLASGNPPTKTIAVNFISSSSRNNWFVMLSRPPRRLLLALIWSIGSVAHYLFRYFEHGVNKYNGSRGAQTLNCPMNMQAAARGARKTNSHVMYFLYDMTTPRQLYDDEDWPLLWCSQQELCGFVLSSPVCWSV